MIIKNDWQHSNNMDWRSIGKKTKLWHLCLWGGSLKKTGSRGEIVTFGERFHCWINHPVLRSGLRSALGMGPAEGYQTGSQVLSWGVGTEVLSRACMSEAGGRSGCGAGWPSLVGWFPTRHHGCGSGWHCCVSDPFCSMVRCMGICPVRETPRASLAALSPYPGIK